MTKQTVDKALLRPEEAAEALGVGRAHVFTLIKSGELRSVKVGRLRRIPTDAIDEYVSRLAESPNPAA